MTNNAIPLYWWEGYYGVQPALTRLLQGKFPYVKNAGDQLSPFIVSLLSGQTVKHTIAGSKLLALGSIFFSLRDHDSVWGAGLINPSHSKFALKSKDVNYLAVRGPETRRELIKQGIDCPEKYGDPAILLPLLIKNDIQKRYAVGIVPHFSHYHSIKKDLQENQQVNVIDMEKPFPQVIKTLLACEVVLSTSLHGLIISEAYGIPALMLTLGQPLHGSLFKFEDYFHSTDRSIQFVDFLKLSHLPTLIDLAQKNLKPSFRWQDLIKTFPFKSQTINASYKPSLTWGTYSFTSTFKQSWLPPYLSVPKSDQ